MDTLDGNREGDSLRDSQAEVAAAFQYSRLANMHTVSESQFLLPTLKSDDTSLSGKKSASISVSIEDIESLSFSFGGSDKRKVNLILPGPHETYTLFSVGKTSPSKALCADNSIVARVSSIMVILGTRENHNTLSHSKTYFIVVTGYLCITPARCPKKY
jgi:hypothetical protein